MPADPENFIALATATIGDNPDSNDGDIFKLVVLSTTWLNARLETGSMSFFYPLYTVERYNYDGIRSRIEDLISSFEDVTWGDLARKIGNFMLWQPRGGETSAKDDWRKLLG